MTARHGRSPAARTQNISITLQESRPPAAQPDPQAAQLHQAEVEKLKHEIDALRQTTSGFGQFAARYWPVLSGIIATVSAVITIIIQDARASQQAEEAEAHAVTADMLDAIDRATSPGSAVTRVAGVWVLSEFAREADGRRAQSLAWTLSTVTAMDPDVVVRFAGAEAIGSVITLERPNTPMRELLYGVRHEGRPGTLTWLDWSVLADYRDGDCSTIFLEEPTTAAGVAARETCGRYQQQLVSIREAIRKNWEDLSDSFLNETWLVQAELYAAHLAGSAMCSAYLWDANLAGADLRDVDLRCADLSEADLIGAQTAGVLWAGANITHAMMSEDAAREALLAGAYIGPEALHREWRTLGCPPPPAFVPTAEDADRVTSLSLMEQEQTAIVVAIRASLPTLQPRDACERSR